MITFGFDPEMVVSPKSRWKLVKLVFNNRETPQGYSIAIGEWDGSHELVMRWNGGEKQPKGHPIVRGLPTWFVIPQKFRKAIIHELDLSSDDLKFCKCFLSF